MAEKKSASKKTTTASKKTTTTSKKTTKAKAKPKAASSAPTKKRARPFKSVLVHYRRHNGDYENWGLHLWDVDEGALDGAMITDWGNPIPFNTEDDFGRIATVQIRENDKAFGFIVHKWEDKDLGGDKVFNPERREREIWLVEGHHDLYTSQEDALASMA